MAVLAWGTLVLDRPEPARTIRLDGAGHEGLSEATVTLFEDGQAKVDMHGTRPADATAPAGFSVLVENLRDAAARRVLEQATARIEAVPTE
ncbi:hypothetical protein BRC81_15175 [Halobacteriales archaeon QS_1_68_20]|nr:MAG: hypothetical protein BRC81_15175 [Halobacteriales archaeon QS_1_68_20]